MKQLLLILVTFCSSSFVFAQKSFEGSITYKLHSGLGDKQDAELKILFGVKKLKILFKEKEDYDKNFLLVLLDSAMVYNVNYEEKTFKRTSLILSNPAQKPEKKMISGYSTTPLQPENTGLGSILGEMIGTSNVVFYLADSLYYYMPAAFRGNKELVMIQKDRIVLGAEIKITNRFMDEGDSISKNNNLVTAEAFEIKPMVVNEFEFIIPADFADRRYLPEPVYTDTAYSAMDTSAVLLDTAVSAPVKKRVKKKPAKGKAPTKITSKAIRRKE